MGSVIQDGAWDITFVFGLVWETGWKIWKNVRNNKSSEFSLVILFS
jgi:hypothetical protein